MNNTLVIFLRAVGIYLLFTLPTLAFPPMYILSAIYALTYGWLAWLVFALIYIGLKQGSFSTRRILIVLAFGVLLGVLLAFQMMEVLNSERNIWQSGLCLLFPCAAIVSGWISLYVSREDIKLDFLSDDISINENEAV